MRKWLLIVLAVICIPLTLIGCVPTATNPSATPATTPIQELQSWKANIDTWKTTVADPAIAKINAPQPAVTVNAQLTADMESAKVTIAELRTRLTELTTRVTDDENQITTLKNSIGSYSNNSGGTNTGGTTGNIPQFTPGSNPGTITTSAGGGVVSQVAFVSGQSQMWTSPTGGSGNVWYIQRLINTSTAIQYIHPTITLGQNTQYGSVAQSYFAGLNVNISSTQGSLQGSYIPPEWWIANPATPSITGLPIAGISASSPTPSPTPTFAPPVAPITYSLLPAFGQPTTSIIIMPSSGLTNNSGTIYLYPGQFIDITVQLQGVYTSTATMWNVTPSFLAST